MGNVAIATMTWDKKGDAKLSLEALSCLRQWDIPVYIADSGSSEGYIKEIKDMGHNIEIVEGPLSTAQKYVIQKAAQNADFVLYTEPDKKDFFQKNFMQMFTSYANNHYDLMAVARTNEQMQTFPEFQQRSEGLMNILIEKETGIASDFVYGPKIFKKELAAELNEIQTDIGWGVLMFLVGRAHKLSYNIGCYYGAAECPESQRKEGNNKYRMKQLFDNNTGFWLGLKK